MKTCSKCLQHKPTEHFRNRKSSKDGKHAQCKQCMSLANRSWREGDVPAERIAEKDRFLRLAREGKRECSRCSKVKPLSGFSSRKEAKDGKRKECRKCRYEYNATYYHENRDKSLIQSALWRAKNPEKIKELSKNYYIKNRQDILEKGCEWRASNAERHRESSREWWKRNKDRVKEKRKLWRKRNKPRLLMYSMLHRTLSQSGGEKKNRTHAILGYSPIQLKEHIEKQFTKGMSWDNYGDWHIDHITSIAEHVRNGQRDPAIINCLTNLRPMWAQDNLRKSDKITHLI